MEGQAHLSRAIAHDNMQQYAAAADCYRHFLGVARKLGDPVKDRTASDIDLPEPTRT